MKNTPEVAEFPVLILEKKEIVGAKGYDKTLYPLDDWGKPLRGNAANQRPLRLETALNRRFPATFGEPLFMMVRPCHRGSWHRPTISCLPQTFAHPFLRLEAAVIAFDFDNANAHTKWPNVETAGRYFARLDAAIAAEPRLREFGIYMTRGGFRLVRPLAESVVFTDARTVSDFEGRLRATAKALDVALAAANAAAFGDGIAEFEGVEFPKGTDPVCCTWWHLFRVPHCVRDGVMQEWPKSLGRMTPLARSEWDALTPFYEPGESPDEIAAADAARAAAAVERAKARAQREADIAAGKIVVRRVRGAGGAVRRDWNSVDLMEFFRLIGGMGKPQGRDKFAVECPWNAEHTTGKPGDGSTSIFTDTKPHRFHCLHSHCAGRSNAALREAYPDDFDAACTEDWIPTEDSPEWKARIAAEAAKDAAIAANFIRRGENFVCRPAAGRPGVGEVSAPTAPLATPPPADTPTTPETPATPACWPNEYVESISRDNLCGIGPRFYTPNKREVAEALRVDHQKQARAVCVCGDMRAGFRGMLRLAGPYAGSVYRAPFACKKLFLCENCARYYSTVRSEEYDTMALANRAKRHWAAAAWTVNGDDPVHVLRRAFEVAESVMGIFKRANVPAARWVLLNQSRLQFGEPMAVSIQFLFEIPKPGGPVNLRTKLDRSEALWTALRAVQCADVHSADFTARSAVYVPAGMVKHLVFSAGGWVPSWACDVAMLKNVMPVLANRKVYRANTAMQRLLGEVPEEEPKAKLDHYGLDIGAVAKLPTVPRFLALSAFCARNDAYTNAILNKPPEAACEYVKSVLYDGDKELPVQRAYLEREALRDEYEMGVRADRIKAQRQFAVGVLTASNFKNYYPAPPLPTVKTRTFGAVRI